MDKKNLYLLTGLFCLASCAWLAWNATMPSWLQPACAFKSVTNTPCPSCGSTRAALLLFRGDLPGSIRQNSLGMVWAFILVLASVWMPVDVLLKQDSLQQFSLAAAKFFRRNLWLVFLLITAVIANWLWIIAGSR